MCLSHECCDEDLRLTLSSLSLYLSRCACRILIICCWPEAVVDPPPLPPEEVPSPPETLAGSSSASSCSSAASGAPGPPLAPPTAPTVPPLSSAGVDDEARSPSPDPPPRAPALDLPPPVKGMYAPTLAAVRWCSRSPSSLVTSALLSCRLLSRASARRLAAAYQEYL
jgi:hypothetical protein